MTDWQWVIVQLRGSGSRLVHAFGPFDTENEAKAARDAFYGELTAVVEVTPFVLSTPEGEETFKTYLQEREADTDIGSHIRHDSGPGSLDVSGTPEHTASIGTTSVTPNYLRAYAGDIEAKHGVNTACVRAAADEIERLRRVDAGRKSEIVRLYHENNLLTSVLGAARFLLQLKDGPRNARYEKAKPKAWEMLRATIKDADSRVSGRRSPTDRVIAQAADDLDQYISRLRRGQCYTVADDLQVTLDDLRRALRQSANEAIR